MHRQIPLPTREVPAVTRQPSAATGRSIDSWAGVTWRSSDVLISPRPDPAHPVVSVKDPTVVRWRDRWLVYGSTADTSGAWRMFSTSFADWSEAPSAPLYHLDQNPHIGDAYVAAPQLFYFSPQDTWYLVYQQGPPAYSVTDDPTRPDTWTAPRGFFAAQPYLLTQGWLDFWVIADDEHCYLFFTDDNGFLYRSRTPVADFPHGFGAPEIAIADTRENCYEGSATYKVLGTDTYLTIVEGFDSRGNRCYRAWTADRLDGPWTRHGSGDQAFAHHRNVSYPAGRWSTDISHGELVRAGHDERMEIDPQRLQLLYQGLDPGVDVAGTPYPLLPWRIGLLTRTDE
ncbi:glycoside hydrolase [Micromonospora sp. KC723]|nr:glycoside hydrolase [Micromonospora sp. KC723]